MDGMAETNGDDLESLAFLEAMRGLKSETVAEVIEALGKLLDVRFRSQSRRLGQYRRESSAEAERFRRWVAAAIVAGMSAGGAAVGAILRYGGSVGP